MSYKLTTRRVVLTSLSVNVLDVLVNLVVALLTGSIVMVVQTLQGLADLISVVLIYIGVSRADKPPDSRHPFGYGREIYFWAFLASMLMLLVTADAAVTLGWQRFNNPEELSHVWMAVIVLLISLVSNGYALSLNTRRLLQGEKWHQIWHQFLNSPLVATKTTFILDFIGTLSPIVGLSALGWYYWSGNANLDGLGAIGIGFTLGGLSLLLLWSIRDLIIGQSASAKVHKRIKTLTMQFPEVVNVLDLKTMMIGSEKLLVNLEVHLIPDLNTSQIEVLMDKMKNHLINAIPDVTHVQIEIETPEKLTY